MERDIEILSPAGSLEKLKFAIRYGADAVYTAGKSFGLRAKSTNLSHQELAEAVQYCHKHKTKIYITVNIFAHNEDIDELIKYLSYLESIEVDALIISDPAVFSLAKEFAANIDIHISTQANVTSWRSVKFWADMGATRVILARELTISEIREIKAKVPNVELEMFVHGAMCMSYSGRCLLSSFLNGRDANRGNCTQPCRWGYNLVEKTRPNELFPIQEDDYGTYILNSKDLSLFDRLKEIIDAGVVSLKIEGRMKSLYYVSVVTRAYKTAVELIQAEKSVPNYLHDELDKVSHRFYTDGFFDSFDSMSTQYHETSTYIREYQFIGEIVENAPKVIIAIRAKFVLGDKIEFIFPNSEYDFTHNVTEILDIEGNRIDFTKPNTSVEIRLNRSIPKNGIVRMKK